MAEPDVAADVKRPWWRAVLTWQGITATIVAATALIVAMQALVNQVPSTLNAIENARNAIERYSMAPPSQPSLPGMERQQPSHNAANSQVTPEEESSELGPPLHPGCNVVLSTDYSIYPPTFRKSWQC